MRMPVALSYSSLELALSKPETFYLDRLASTPSERRPQGRPAAAGSASDAILKSHLAHDVLGTVPADLEYEALFEKQVEAEHRDWARGVADHVFTQYDESGAYGDLRDMLLTSDETPRFEFEVRREIAGVPLVGRPDCYFVWKKMPIVLDWKVRGYCSSASPSPGYVLCRDGFAGKASRSHGKAHKKYEAWSWEGLDLSHAALNEMNPAYAKQTAMYGWLMGQSPGDEMFLAWIDEICGSPRVDDDKDRPSLRVATHRGPIAGSFQLEYLEQIKTCWQGIISGHFFSHLSRESSDALCELLEQTALIRSQPTPRAEAQVANLMATYGVCA